MESLRKLSAQAPATNARLLNRPRPNRKAVATSFVRQRVKLLVSQNLIATAFLLHRRRLRSAPAVQAMTFANAGPSFGPSSSFIRFYSAYLAIGLIGCYHQRLLIYVVGFKLLWRTSPPLAGQQPTQVRFKAESAALCPYLPCIPIAIQERETIPLCRRQPPLSDRSAC